MNNNSNSGDRSADSTNAHDDTAASTVSPASAASTTSPPPAVVSEDASTKKRDSVAKKAVQWVMQNSNQFGRNRSARFIPSSADELAATARLDDNGGSTIMGEIEEGSGNQEEATNLDRDKKKQILLSKLEARNNNNTNINSNNSSSSNTSNQRDNDSSNSAGGIGGKDVGTEDKRTEPRNKVVLRLPFGDVELTLGIPKLRSPFPSKLSLDKDTNEKPPGKRVDPRSSGDRQQATEDQNSEDGDEGGDKDSSEREKEVVLQGVKVESLIKKNVPDQKSDEAKAFINEMYKEAKREERLEIMQKQLVKMGGSEKELKDIRPIGSYTRDALYDLISVPSGDVSKIRSIFGSETFFATDQKSKGGTLEFRGNLRGDPEIALQKMQQRIQTKLGDKYTIFLEEGDRDDPRPVVQVVRTLRLLLPNSAANVVFSLIDIVLSILSLVAYQRMQFYYGVQYFSSVSRLPTFPSGSAQVVVLIYLILFLREVIQRSVARSRNAKMGLSFYLPSASGPMAVISDVPQPPSSRRALFDIGVAGAGAMLFISLAVFCLGVLLSNNASAVYRIPVKMASSSFLLGGALKWLLPGYWLESLDGALIGLHPLAIGGAYCAKLAALNLLPLRQLDGGRIVYALYGKKTGILLHRLSILFLLLVSSTFPGVLWFIVMIILGPWPESRPPRNGITEPDNFRTVFGLGLIMLALSVLLPLPKGVLLLQ
eukprot:CAMPEP_0184694878 /NCGR_PEP_ID=MMETSP0313-20130426/2696_1 /TAXON_ID=2792 /ORGANISM="Porphyridium aerugineum, Strain SAG 1380-2" /LENGTH=710 /DNA_ID=CAMNT_0027153239 /DNA_START=246 /DNA_END=2378 /DNA_ORIENTATION=+